MRQLSSITQPSRVCGGAVFRDERLCFLSYDDEHHRLALIHIPDLPVRDPDAVGTDHVAYAHNDLGELLSTYRRLKAAGKLPHWPINHGVTTSMYYRDPDNNRVELQIDNFATSAELDGYFHSRAFTENPVGVTYDPEALCRRYEAGEAMTDLPHPANAPGEDPLGHAGEPLIAFQRCWPPDGRPPGVSGGRCDPARAPRQPPSGLSK
jgi:hypothetical protein